MQGRVKGADINGQYREERLKCFPKPLVVTGLFFTSLQGSGFRLAIPEVEVVFPFLCLPRLRQPLVPTGSLRAGRH